MSGGEPKLVWPRGAPCSKLYTSAGKYVVRGPPPEGFTILMSELYETEVGYHTWVTKLAAWQNDLGKPKTISICQCDTVGTLATCALWNIQVF